MTAGQRIVGLIVAAGSGSRTGLDTPKQFAPVAGKPLVRHAVDHLAPLCSAIRVVIGPDQRALYDAAIGDSLAGDPVIGGDVRRLSVLNGLEAIARVGGADLVLIHDAARAFLPASVGEALISALADSEGVVPVLPVVDTLARTDDALGEPVSRDGLVRVQTPQAFRFGAILAAHRAWRGEVEPTDDAQVARGAGITITTIKGDEALEKITLAEDFNRAERRLRGAMTSRTGTGFDVHALAEGEELWLGGLLIPHPRGLAGHSDADVALHALTDALLGAAALGDIGEHFPPSDPRWRGARSDQFVRHAADLIRGLGGVINHVDVTIICEAPRIGPHKAAMRDAIAAMLQLRTGQVSVKATTTERLGFTGRGEGIAVQAVATIRLPEEP